MFCGNRQQNTQNAVDSNADNRVTNSGLDVDIARAFLHGQSQHVGNETYGRSPLHGSLKFLNRRSIFFSRVCGNEFRILTVISVAKVNFLARLRLGRSLGYSVEMVELADSLKDVAP